MRITVCDGWYRRALNTGPTHTYLGVRFSANATSVFEVEVLPPIGACPHGQAPTGRKVRPWIEEGLYLAEAEAGRAFSVERVEVIENDSRRPEVYRELARQIALKFHATQS